MRGLDRTLKMEGAGLHLFRGSRLVQTLGFTLKNVFRYFYPELPLEAFASPTQIGAVYVINLDRQPARWEGLKREARRKCVQGGGTLLDFCHRVSAVDGKSLNLSEADGLINPTYPLDDQYHVDPDPHC